MYEPGEYDQDRIPARDERPRSYHSEPRAGHRRDGEWEARPSQRQDSGDHYRAGDYYRARDTRQAHRLPPDADRERSAAAARRGRRPESPRTLGSLTAGAGIGVIFGAAVLGAVVTVVIGQAPGPVLGGCLIAGTTVAALAVKWRRANILIPVPALAYVLTSAAAGMIHDRALDTSRTALAVNAADWVARGFLAMTAATAIATGIFAARFFAARRTARRPAPAAGRRLPGSPAATAPVSRLPR